MMQLKTKEFIGLEDRFGAKNYKPLDVILNKGEGIWVPIPSGLLLL